MHGNSNAYSFVFSHFLYLPSANYYFSALQRQMREKVPADSVACKRFHASTFFVMHQGYKGGVVTLSLLGTGIEWPILKPNRYNRLVVATAHSNHTLKCQDLFLSNHSSHLKAKKVTLLFCYLL